MVRHHAKNLQIPSRDFIIFAVSAVRQTNTQSRRLRIIDILAEQNGDPTLRITVWCMAEVSTTA